MEAITSSFTSKPEIIQQNQNRIVKSSSIKVSGPRSTSNTLNAYQDVANKIMKNRDHKLLRTIISTRNEEDESERQEGKFVRGFTKTSNRG